MFSSDPDIPPWCENYRIQKKEWNFFAENWKNWKWKPNSSYSVQKCSWLPRRAVNKQQRWLQTKNLILAGLELDPFLALPHLPNASLRASSRYAPSASSGLAYTLYNNASCRAHKSPSQQTILYLNTLVIFMIQSQSIYSF